MQSDANAFDQDQDDLAVEPGAGTADEMSEPEEQTLAIEPTKEDEAPAVVAVVVASNPGPWFEESLHALGEQGYVNFSVLVIDAGSEVDQVDRVAQHLPSAFVRRLSVNPGYAAATNRALRIIEGADYLLLCHDDVAPAPNAVRLMVERAHKTGAEVVTPKYLDWNERTCLRSVGGTVDVTGAFLPTAEPGELDQGQHDSLTQTFVTQGGCLLVSTEMFSRLGGLDATMTHYGEGLDFTWRVQVAGGRVDLVPAAHVRHLEASSEAAAQHREPYGEVNDEDADTWANDLILQRRHRFRTALKVHRGVQFILAFGTQLLLTIAEVLYGVVSGRRDVAAASLAAVTWNAAHWRSLLKSKRALDKVRKVSGRDLKQHYGSSRRRISDATQVNYQNWREEVARRDFSTDVSNVARTLRRVPVLVFVLLVALWLIGSRDLLSAPLPQYAQFMPLDEPIDSMRRYLGIWSGDAFGNVTAATPAHLLLAIPETLFFGATAAAQKALVLLAIPFGVWGISRLARPLRSASARRLAALAYAALPLGYDALGSGRFDALVVYAIMPFLFNRLLRLDGTAPYPVRRGLLHLSLRRAKTKEDHIEPVVLGPRLIKANVPTVEALVIDPGPETPILAPEVVGPVSEDRLGWYSFLVLRRLLPLGLVAAITAAFAPQVLTVTLVVVAAMLLGDLLAGDRRTREDFVRVSVISLGALFLAVLLLLPAFVGSEQGWSALWSMPFLSVDAGLSSLLGFQASGRSVSVLTLLLLVIAAVPLVLGNEWRFRLAVKMWMVTLVTVLLLWLSLNNWLGGINLDPWVWLTPAAVASALNVGVAVVALQVDSTAKSAAVRRGLRIGLGACVVLLFVPIVGLSTSGSWGLPTSSSASLLAWMRNPTAAPNDPRGDGSARTLWLGDAQALPGGPRNFNGIAGAITVDGPTTSSMAPASLAGTAQDDLADAVSLTSAGESVQFGRLIAPYSVRYIVVPTRTGGSVGYSRALDAPTDLIAALDKQLDLRKVESDSAVTVYENDAWIPRLAALSDTAILAAHTDTQTGTLGQSAAVSLAGDNHASFVGKVEQGELFVGQEGSDAWSLTLDGRVIDRQDAFGWASSFTIPQRGQAQLLYEAPSGERSFQVLNATLWIVAVAAALHYLPRRKQFA